MNELPSEGLTGTSVKVVDESGEMYEVDASKKEELATDELSGRDERESAAFEDFRRLIAERVRCLEVDGGTEGVGESSVNEESR